MQLHCFAFMVHSVLLGIEVHLCVKCFIAMKNLINSNQNRSFFFATLFKLFVLAEVLVFSQCRCAFMLHNHHIKL